MVVFPESLPVEESMTEYDGVQGVHGWWFRQRNDQDATKRLKTMVEIREFVDSLPETRRSFTRPDLGDYQQNVITEEMMIMAKSWRVPEPFHHDRGNAQAFVNPKYKHAHGLPHVWARCGCGTPMTHLEDYGHGRFQVEHEHADDCCKLDRLEGRTRLMHKRKDRIQRCYGLGLTGPEIASQIALDTDNIGQQASKVGVDSMALRRRFLRRASRTYIVMRRRGISAQLIAKAYGVTPATLRRRARNYTNFEYNMSERDWEYNV